MEMNACQTEVSPVAISLQALPSWLDRLQACGDPREEVVPIPCDGRPVPKHPLHTSSCVSNRSLAFLIWECPRLKERVCLDHPPPTTLLALDAYCGKSHLTSIVMCHWRRTLPNLSWLMFKAGTRWRVQCNSSPAWRALQWKSLDVPAWYRSSVGHLSATQCAFYPCLAKALESKFRHQTRPRCFVSGLGLGSGWVTGLWRSWWWSYWGISSSICWRTSS